MTYDAPTPPPNDQPMLEASEPAEPLPLDDAPLIDSGTDESFKQTVLSLIVAFVLALVFRAYVVEAFVIPTGSMAPTLLGKHQHYLCDQCGYEFDACDEQNRHIFGGNDDRRPAVDVYCPMCKNLIVSPIQAMSAGDRILVHKYIYSVSEPRRWDVVVFKNPENADVNYIKRLIGLPNEQVFIIDGNIYIERDGAWRIARKTDRPAVQNAMWVPIYHSRYIPLDEGRVENNPDRVDVAAWRTPWFADYPSDHWDIDNRRAYRHDSDQAGRIFFDFQEATNPYVVSWYAWNQHTREFVYDEPIEDVRLATQFTPDAGGLTIRLETTSRLDNGALSSEQHFLTATLVSDGTVTLSRSTFDRSHTLTLQTGSVEPIRAGETRAIELWYVDQEASVWVDGDRVLVHQFDLATIEDARDRPAPTDYPLVSIAVEGSPVTLRDVEVDRDLFYVSQKENRVARAGYAKEANWSDGEPLQLYADEFFCLGDNGPVSEDGRYWDSLDPWVQERMFDGNPRYGVVPRKLMMGRAFFVYFPAPYALSYKTPAWVPNFGKMRFIH